MRAPALVVMWTASYDPGTHDEDTEEVTRKMADSQIRRLPVVNRDKRLIGILSLGDVATSRNGADEAGEALSDISRPGGEHSQMGGPKG